MRNFLLAATVAAVAAFSSVAAKAVPVDPNGELSSSAAVGSAPDGVVGGTLGAGTTSFSNVPTAYTVIGTGPVGAGTYNLGAANGDAMALNVSTLDKTGTTLPLIISVTTATDVLTFTFSN